MLFSNVPNVNFKQLICDNFESLLKALKLQNTEQQTSLFSRNIWHKKPHEILNASQEEALLNVEFIAKEISKISTWCENAHKANQTMSTNASFMPPVTDEEKEFARSLVFDWHYSYSDDGGVYRRGEESRKRVAKHVNQVLANKPHLSKVVKEVANANSFNETFFTNIS